MLGRVIPVLLYKKDGLYKGVKFKHHKYVGDPHNAVRIFSEKEVDELILLDIEASRNKTKPDISFIERLAEECYMPFAIGGGVNDIETIRDVLKAGAEKVIINSEAIRDPKFIKRASEEFGSSTIVVSIDYSKNFFSKNKVVKYFGFRQKNLELLKFAKIIEENGAGEIIFTSIDREGTGIGLDLITLKDLSTALNIPIVGCGGVGKVAHIEEGFKAGGVSAVAAGSFFTFKGNDRSVLISYSKEWESLKVNM